MKLKTDEFEAKMKKSLAVYAESLSTIRAGRANPEILSRVTVNYYGAPTPITQVLRCVTDPRTITVTPWDLSMPLNRLNVLLPPILHYTGKRRFIIRLINPTAHRRTSLELKAS